jgi:hypothetical protein
LNSAYDEDTLHQAQRSFGLSGNIQLQSFLSEKGFALFKHLKFRHVYVPEKCCYSIAGAPELKGFNAVLSSIVGKKVKAKSVFCFMFGKGDYTLLYDAIKPGSGVAFFLDLFDFDESLGGFSSFLKDSKEVFRVVAKSNSLTLVNQSGLKSFVKFVNHHAPNPRVFLYGVLQ